MAASAPSDSTGAANSVLVAGYVSGAAAVRARPDTSPSSGVPKKNRNTFSIMSVPPPSAPSGAARSGERASRVARAAVHVWPAGTYAPLAAATHHAASIASANFITAGMRLGCSRAVGSGTGP